MKIETTYDDPSAIVVSVKPWPDEPFSATVEVYHQRNAYEMFDRFPRRTGDIAVRYGQNWTTPQVAREFAEAILAACDIADSWVSPPDPPADKPLTWAEKLHGIDGL